MVSVWCRFDEGTVPCGAELYAGRTSARMTAVARYPVLGTALDTALGTVPGTALGPHAGLWLGSCQRSARSQISFAGYLDPSQCTHLIQIESREHHGPEFLCAGWVPVFPPKKNKRFT